MLRDLSVIFELRAILHRSPAQNELWAAKITLW